MPKDFDKKEVLRIIDANTNRAKEGLRVCEEIVRFYLNSPRLTLQFKKARHKLDDIINKLLGSKINLILQRLSSQDVGRSINKFEFNRAGLTDIFLANIQRVKESIRVLEEFSKIKNKNIALDLKKIRYAIYELEKAIIKKMQGLHHPG